jgi:hypothetical protein
MFITESRDIGTAIIHFYAMIMLYLNIDNQRGQESRFELSEEGCPDGGKPFGSELCSKEVFSFNCREVGVVQ